MLYFLISALRLESIIKGDCGSIGNSQGRQMKWKTLKGLEKRTFPFLIRFVPKKKFDAPKIFEVM